MEGDLNHGQSHGFLPDDMVFDDLINNPGWPASVPGNQYSYQETHAPQNAYTSQYQPTPQPRYNQFDLPQQSAYQQMPYSNSPYAPTPQYQQHSRPSNTFGAAQFIPVGVDPSLQHPASYQTSTDSFAYAPQPNGHATITPHSLYGNTNPQLQTMNRAHSNSPFQQQPVGTVNGFNHAAQNHSGLYFNNYQLDNTPSNPGTPVQYPKLPNGNVAVEVNSGMKISFDDLSRSHVQVSQLSTSIPQVILPSRVPHIPQVSQVPQIPQAPQVSQVSQIPQTPQVTQVTQEPLPQPTNSLRITNPELLATKANRPKHPLEIAPYVVVMEVPGAPIQPGLKTAIPKYVPRPNKSGVDIHPQLKLSGTETKPLAKKRGRPPKDKTATSSKYKGTGRPLGRPPKATTAIKALREDGSIKNSPSASTETSSSEEDSSSEDESEEEEGEAMPVTFIESVRGAVRPAKPALAAEWDAIGIIWKDPNSKPALVVINESIVKYSNSVIDLKNQLKTIAVKIAEAAARPNEVTQLENQRTELLDALYYTVHAAVEHGYPIIVERLGGNPKLVHALGQTLRDCINANDYGKLPKEVISLMTKFTTLSDEVLSKLKFDSIQKRWNKKTDDVVKNNFLKIYANTTDAREKAEKAQKSGDEKKAREPVEQSKQRKTEAMKTTVANSAKRPHEGDGSNGKPAKKFASDVSGTPGLSIKSTIVKKPTGNLLGIAARPAGKPAAKKREPSPPQESKLGALLASIAKPAEPPKAPPAPPRAPESPEEKARRERKESRRHLRVKFKEGPELEQIRLFKHEQGEDEGRQDDMLRDANDTHNEGMMHKKRVSETIEEDDDYQPPDVEEAPFPEPKGVDFSQSEKATRYGPIFTTRGGELQFTTPEQKTQERREAVELLVIYTDPSDIPPSAKEPPLNNEVANSQFSRQIPSPSEPWLLQRIQELNHYGPIESFRLFASRFSAQEPPESRARRIAQSFQTTLPLSANTSSAFTQPPTSQASQIKAQIDQINRASTMSDDDKYQYLQSILDSIRGKPFPPTEPPEWMTNEQQRNIWIEGHHRDNAERLNREAELSIEQAYQQHTPAPTPHFNQPLAAIPAQQYHPATPSSMGQQATHIYANGNGNKSAASSQPFDYNAWASANNMGSRASDNIRPPRREEPDLARHDRDDRFQSTFNSKSKNYQHDAAREPLDKNGAYRYKKEPCKYFPRGMCAKGDGCTYSHEKL